MLSNYRLKKKSRKESEIQVSRGSALAMVFDTPIPNRSDVAHLYSYDPHVFQVYP